MDKTLEVLLKTFGVSGHESEIRKVIKGNISNPKAEVIEDKMGNVTVKLGSGKEKLMVVAHMDEMGLIVSYIEDNGEMKAEKVGNFSESYFGNSIVKFENGIEGIALFKDDKTFIDAGFKDKKEAETSLKEGDVAGFTGNYLEHSNTITGPKMDDRAGCYVLLSLINELKDLNKEVYFVFSAQQNLGGRGARAAANCIKPDKCIVLEAENCKNGVELSKGPVLSIMDKSLVINHDIKEEIEKAAEKTNIKLQYTVSEENTDGGLIQKECFGVKTAVLSIPCKYIHTPTEMVHTSDIETAKKLVKEFIMSK